ncbi:MAG: GAF domain-containing protein [Prochloraceae cyanobacterium]|nr:GAF domain-containing protein [Prochloraceae cyanobacterium]
MSDPSLARILKRINLILERDSLVQQTLQQLREKLQVERVITYYFYRKWEGQVTCESLISPRFSILGSTGPDECFNGEYARMYEEGRIRAIEDIETEAIAPCHRLFLRDMQVRANLVVPILNNNGLWGLLIAHQCRDTRVWCLEDTQAMQEGATTLAMSDPIQNS